MWNNQLGKYFILKERPNPAVVAKLGGGLEVERLLRKFNKLFKKINIIESQNLVVTSTSEKGNFKCIRKILHQ